MAGKAGGGNFQYAAGANNRLATMFYDNAGNLLNDGSYVWNAYDNANQLVNVGGPFGYSYVYDASGQRFQKWFGGAGFETYWYGAGSDPLAEGDAAGNLSAEYVYMNGRRIARVDLPAGSAHYYFSDHLKSTSLVINRANGQVEEESDYTPYGTEIPIISSGQNHYKFTGKERDSESGLDYFGARYLSSPQGRWTSPDPTLLSVNAFNPQSWNRYAYVLNNPLKFIDPLGLWELVASDNDTVDKKGKHHHHITLTARQSQKGDDGASLAKQLGLKGKAAEKFAAKVGSGDNIQLSKQGGTVGRVFADIEQHLTDQANYGGTGGPGPSSVDCSQTAAELGFARPFQGGVGTPGMDTLLGQSARSESAADAMVGDIVRYASEKNVPLHFTTFIFMDDSGTPVVFSRSGMGGPYQWGAAQSFEGDRGNGVNYGTIRGVNKNDSGYYRPGIIF